MLQQRIRQSLAILFGRRDHSRLEAHRVTGDFKRITREEMEALTTKELQRRAVYESLAEHQRLIEAEEDADKRWEA